MRRVFLFSGLLSFAGTGLACGGVSPEEEARIDQQLAETAKTLAAIDQTLAAMPDFTEQTCDSSKVQPLLRDPFASTEHNVVLGLQAEELKRYANGPFQQSESRQFTTLGVNDPDLISLQSTFLSGDGWAKQSIVEHLNQRAQVVAVYVPLLQSAPKAEANATDFEPGLFDGYLTFWSLASGEYLCAAHIHAEGPDILEVDAGGIYTAQEVAEQAFDALLKERATEARKRASPDLRLGYDWMEGI